MPSYLIPAFAVCLIAICAWLWLRSRLLRKIQCRDGVIHHHPDITSDELGRLKAHLERVGYFVEGQSYVVVDKARDKYEFQRFVVPGTLIGEEDLGRCAVIAAALEQEVFSGKNVEVQVRDDRRFQVLAAVSYRGQFGRRIRFNGAEVFCTSGTVLDEIQRLGEYLVTAGFFNDKPKLAQFNRTESGYELRLQVKEGCVENPDLQQEFRGMGADLSRLVFQGSPVEVRMATSLLEVLQKRDPC